MILAIKCPLCGNWMPVLKTKKGRPFAYCGREKFSLMVVTKVGMEAVDKVAQEVSESDLIPETKKWLDKKRAEAEE